MSYWGCLLFIKTSVEHGASFGKAVKGTANLTSLIETVKLAGVMVRNR
jgi:4-hydroxy-L-threonine phosphate dehydrogenase PdxA